MGEAALGAGAVVLAILALIGFLPMTLTCIAVIALGVALLLHGGAVAARFNELSNRMPARTEGMAEFGGGLGVEFLGGLAGIALGVLSLVGIMPATLLPISVIALGGSVFLGAGVVAGLNRARIYTSGETVASQYAAGEAANAAAGMESLVGISGVVLGILALIGIAPATLTIIGVLCLGSGVLMSGSVVGAKMASASGNWAGPLETEKSAGVMNSPAADFAPSYLYRVYRGTFLSAISAN
jgi:hypothetical protein